VLVVLVGTAVVAPVESASAAAAGDKVKRRALTTAGPRSVFTGTLPTIRVTARGRRSPNRREIFYPARTADMTNSESCATWVEGHGSNIQQGAAFRMVRTGKVTRAITITKNVSPFPPRAPLPWIFQVNLWNTASPTRPFTPVGSINLRALLAPPPSTIPVPFPWHFCARVVGSTLSFIVWLQNQPRPAWNDPNHGGTVTLPAGSTTPGKTGWYIGHLASGETALFTNLTTRPL
jgi:hypothetical protein